MPQPTSLRPSKPNAPDHLASEEATLYAQIVKAYDLRDEVSCKILEEACTSLQRARLAREAVEKQGMTVKDSKNQTKAHPLLTVERDARSAALSAFRQLNLEMPRTVGKKSAW